MLVLNFMYMKKNLFRFSSRRFLFSTVMASALVTGAPQAVFAYVGEVQAVSQTGTIKGKCSDPQELSGCDAYCLRLAGYFLCNV